MESLDIKAFIVEVQGRPAIWDSRSTEYSDRDIKKSLWEELVNIFIPNKNPTVDEKRNFEQFLHRRWKSLRDSYAREVKLQNKVKSESGERRRPTYVFFKQLYFLEAVVGTQPLHKSMTDDPTAPSATQQPISSAKRKKEDALCERLVKVVEKRVQQRQERDKLAENDCDRLFLLSMLNPLKDIPEYARFQVKRKLMDVLDTELQFYRQPSGPGQQFSLASASTTTYDKAAARRTNFRPLRKTNFPDSPPVVNTQLTPTTYYPNGARSPFTIEIQDTSSDQEMCETETNKSHFSSSVPSPESDSVLFGE